MHYRTDYAKMGNASAACGAALVSAGHMRKRMMVRVWWRCGCGCVPYPKQLHYLPVNVTQGVS